jgi:hypothetical protein
MKVKLTLTEGMLGTKAAKEELLADFIASKHPEAAQDDEMDTMPDMEEELKNGTTVFNRDDDGTPFIFDYQIKGFFKDAQGVLGRIPENKMPAFKKIIDGLIFIDERRIRLEMPEGKNITFCERPLRAQTAQGERISLARSEEVPAGTTMTFTITMLDEKLKKNVMEWLKYGALRGLGQWRNSGKGRFSFEVLD